MCTWGERQRIQEKVKIGSEDAGIAVVEMKTQSSVQKENGRDVGGGLRLELGSKAGGQQVRLKPTLLLYPISGTTESQGVESRPLLSLSLWFVDF